MQLGKDVADVVVCEVRRARLGEEGDRGGGFRLEVRVDAIDGGVREKDARTKRRPSEKLGRRHEDGALLVEPAWDERGVVTHLARVQHGHDALAELLAKPGGDVGGGEAKTRLGASDGVQDDDGGGVGGERLTRLGLDELVVILERRTVRAGASSGDEIDRVHVGEVVQGGEFLAHGDSIAAEGHRLAEEATHRRLGGARANLARARDEGDDVTALWAVGVLLGTRGRVDGARDRARLENRLEQRHRLGVGSRRVNHHASVAAAEELLDANANFVHERHVGFLLALPHPVKHLLGRLEGALGGRRGGARAAVEQVRRPGVHAGEVLVQPAVAVKGGAVVASLLHQTHQALVHHLFLETAHERGESLDAERLGVRGRVLRRLQRRQRKRISAIIIPASGTSEMNSWSRSHTHMVTRATSSRPSMRGDPIKNRTPWFPSPASRCEYRRKCGDARRSSLKTFACAAPVADGANRRGRPQVGRNLDEIAKARDAHTVAHADGDARRGLGVLGHVAVLRSSSAGAIGDATTARRRAANARARTREAPRPRLRFAMDAKGMVRFFLGARASGGDGLR